MSLLSAASHDTPPLVIPRVRASLVPMVLGGLGIVILTCQLLSPVPQIGQSCATCYLGAFGPPLEPYGHPVKRPGDSAADGEPAHPMTMPVEPRASGLDGGPRWIVPNRSFGLETDRVARRAGEFSMPVDGGTANRFDLGMIAMWHPRAVDLSGPAAGDFVADAGPAMDAKQTPDEITTYRDGGADGRNSTTLIASPAALWVDGSIPHWRVAVQKDLERHFVQMGRPAAASAAGIPSDGNANKIVSDPPSLTDESQPLTADIRLVGIDGFNTLDTFRAGAPYRFAATGTPAVQYFHIAGPVDTIRYFWPDVRPNSTGVIAGLAYTPWDRPGSPVQFLNLRFAAQYATTKEVTGIVHGAGANNTLVLSLWGALHF